MKFLIIFPILGLSGLFYFYFKQESLIFYPSKLPADHKYNFPLKFEELNWNVEEDVTINALHFKHPRSKGVILYFHGNAGNLNSWGMIYTNFYDFGFDMIIMDYRGYGKSTGKLNSEKDILKDASYAYQYAKSIFPEDKIILFGRSLGSGPATYLAKVNNPKALFLESPFNSLKEVASYHFPYIPTFLIKYPMKSEEWIKDIRCEIFLFHGTEDEIIPVEFAERLAKNAKQEKLHKFIIEGGNHNNLEIFPEYRKGVIDSMSSILSGI